MLDKLNSLRIGVTVILLMAFVLGPVEAAVTDALARPAVSTQLGAQSFLLGVDQIGGRIVAVGERGLILLSDDNANNWRQAPSPVSVTLTAVRFADSRNGYAIGHGGVVLSTSDSGETWQRRLDGYRIAQILLQVAKSSADERNIAAAERMVADGPDKPLLDLLVFDSQRLLVSGAYGILLFSDDGGQSWKSWGDRIDNPGAVHLYAMRKAGNRLLIAGEMGMVWLSEDGGDSFTSLITPYEGSFFTAELSGEREIVLAGLRGNVWRSQDNGVDWSQLSNPVPATINASIIGADNDLLLVNHAGMILRLTQDRLVPITIKSLPPLNNILQKNDGELLVLSVRGPISLDPGAMK